MSLQHWPWCNTAITRIFGYLHFSPPLSTTTTTHNRDIRGASLLKLIAEPEVGANACAEVQERAKALAQDTLEATVKWAFSFAENEASFEEMYAALSPLRALVRRALNAETFAQVVGPPLAKTQKRNTTAAVSAVRVILELSSPRRLDLSIHGGSGCFEDGTPSSLLPLIVSELRSPKADAVRIF